MKKHLQTAICILLLLSMIAVLVACGDSEAGNDDSSAAASGTTSTEDPGDGYMNADGVYSPKIGVLDDYKGRTFSILVVGDAGTYQSDDFSTEQGESGIDYGDSYYTAVSNRNDKIEELYGVTLDLQKIPSPYSAASQDAVAGTQLYDAVLLNVGNMTTLARDGYLCDLNTLTDYIDLNAPWWSASANEAYSIGEKLFFTTGDITIMNKANSWSILFNKQMIEEYKLESPYELFRNGNWTFDKMVEMASAVSNATPTSDWKDSNTVYGMITAYGDLQNFYGASGMLLCQKDAKNEPALLFGTDESSINLAVKILDTYNNADWKIYATDCTGGSTGDIWEDSFGIFYNGRALFRPSGFTAVAKMRTRSDIEFGIVPMPKMTEGQEEYTAMANSGFAAGIIKTCADPEFSAYMLDAVSAAAKYDKTGGITYEYLETTLKGKSYIDDESREMVDYIFSHLQYDVGLVYGFGGVNGILSTLAQSKGNGVRSQLDSISGQIDTAIEETIADYEANT